MTEPDDPIIRQLREAISDNDRKLMETLNKRLELVARLKRYKDSHGIGFVDPEREEWMLELPAAREPRPAVSRRRARVLHAGARADEARSLLVGALRRPRTRPA